MNLVRGLERRLEAVMDGLAGRIFRGSLHPTELATRLLRHADLSLTQVGSGYLAANSFQVRTAPLAVEAETLERISNELRLTVEHEALERGWRLEGPVGVSFEADPSVVEGDVQIEALRVPGPRAAWARLMGDPPHPICVNYCVVGRSPQADVVITKPSVSRRHAVIWTVAGSYLLSDLGSANGTRVDGVPAGADPVRLHHLSKISFGEVAYRFETA